MSCTSFDLKEYALGEGARDDRKRVESHAAECRACRDEIARLELTQAALLSVRDEEIPQRIAFVSDKIFEPRWYQRLWSSGARLGFASAAMLAAAIVVHGFATRPVSVPAQTAVVDHSQIEAEVAKAVAASETRQQQKTVELLQAAEQKYQGDRRLDLATYSEHLRMLQRQMANQYRLANNLQ